MQTLDIAPLRSESPPQKRSCGMVLCLVTLTDLETRRAGLSASAELLVYRVVKRSLYTHMGTMVCNIEVARWSQIKSHLFVSV